MTPVEAQKDRKKERRRVGVRRGGRGGGSGGPTTNLNGSAPTTSRPQPGTPIEKGPDVSLLEKMAIFEKGGPTTDSHTAKPVVAATENGEKLAGSKIVLDRMAMFEKAA